MADAADGPALGGNHEEPTGTASRAGGSAGHYG